MPRYVNRTTSRRYATTRTRDNQGRVTSHFIAPVRPVPSLRSMALQSVHRVITRGTRTRGHRNSIARTSYIPRGTRAYRYQSALTRHPTLSRPS